MFLTKKNGIYIPSYNSDKLESDKVRDGEEIKAVQSRNPKFHRKMFGLWNMWFENQDEYGNFNLFRYDKTIAAGFAEIDLKNHRVCAKSLKYDMMPENEFEELFKEILKLASKALETKGEVIIGELENFY